jgi:signal transduction histidine kinase
LSSRSIVAPAGDRGKHYPWLGRAAELLSEIDPSPGALRVFLSAYFVILGASLLILPFPQASGPPVEEWTRGLVTAGTGLALLWLGFVPRGAGASRILHVLAATPQAWLGFDMLASGSLVAGFMLGLFAVAAAMLPAPRAVRHLVPGEDSPSDEDNRGEVLAYLLLLVIAVQGIVTIAWPESVWPIPAGSAISPAVMGVALTGSAVLAGTLMFVRAPRPMVAAGTAAVAGLAFASFALSAAVVGASLWLVGGATYLRIVALGTYPWRTRMTIDWRGLESLLAAALVTAAIVPALVVVTIDHALAEPSAYDTPARQVLFAAISLCVVGAFVAGWAGGRLLTEPIARIATRVGRIRLGDRGEMGDEVSATQLVAIAAAVDHTIRDLDAERTEKSRLIGELVERNRQLAQATAVKDEFLGLVSHELKTPITTVLGNLALLARRTLPVDAAPLVHDALSESERLAGIVDNLLVLARLDAGQEPATEPVLINQLVRTAVRRAQRQHPDRQVHVQPAGSLIAQANPEHLDMVLRNYLGNAVKYSEPGAPIEVEIQIDGHHAVVSVLDEGPGLSGEDRQRVFDAFYRGSSTSSRVQGMGIGLTVCQRVVEAAGGRCWVETRRDRPGSVFRFSVPILPEHDITGEPGDSQGAARRMSADASVPSVSTSASIL